MTKTVAKTAVFVYREPIELIVATEAKTVGVVGNYWPQ